MNKPLLTDNSHDFDIWYKSADPSFVEINSKSRVPHKWLTYRNISSSGVLKPINKYVEVLYPRPKIVSVSEEKIVLRYFSHADIYLIENFSGHKGFYNVDRPWMRQYYNTVSEKEISPSCFPGHYKFYIPWIIDYDVAVKITEPPESSFLVFDQDYFFRSIGEHEEFVEPGFVRFNFKRAGPHMASKEFGIIRRGSPMFDIAIPTDGIIEKRLKEVYEN
jgi:hypothetical protein